MKILLKKSKKWRAAAGFTLAEVMVGSMTFLITAGSLYTGMLQSIGMVKSSREELRANQILLDKLEAVRLYNWTQMNSQWVNSTFTDKFDPTPGAQGTITYSGTVRLEDAGMPSAYNNTMKRVVVTTSWTSGNTTKTRSVSTLLSQYGTQKFIYEK